MKKSTFLTTLLAATVSLTLSSTVHAAPSCDTVKLAEPGWSDLALTTGMTTLILENLGYETDNKILGIPVIYEAMVNKQLDVFMGYWDPAMVTYYSKYKANGSVHTLHKNLTGAKFTLAVSKNAYDAGVTDFAHLNDFADKFEHKIYGIEPGSNETIIDMISDNQFGMKDWEIVESSEQGMLAQVNRAIRRDEWVVFLAWAPHPMNTEFEIEYLTGGDDIFGPDFGGASVHTQIRKGYETECPNIAKLLNQITFDIPMESKGMGYILNDGDAPVEASLKLLQENSSYLPEWLDGVTTKDGKSGLEIVRSKLGL